MPNYHPFKQRLLDALSKIKNNQLKGSPHLPIEVYAILIDSLTNSQFSLEKIFESEEKYQQLQTTIINLPENSQFEGLFKAYELGLDYRQQIKQKLQNIPPTNQKERQKILTQYYTNQKVFFILSANLPAEYLLNNTFLEQLGSSILSLDLNKEGNLKQTLTEKINHAAQNTTLPSPNPSIINSAVSQAITILKPQHLVTPAITPLALLTTLKFFSQFNEEESSETTEETKEKPFPIGFLLGTTYFFLKKLRRKKKIPEKDELESEKQSETPTPETTLSPPPITQTTSPPTPSLPTQKLISFLKIPSFLPSIKPFFASVKRIFTKLLGKAIDIGLTFLSVGTSKILTVALRIGRKLISFVGKFLTFFNEIDIGNNLQKITSLAFVFILLPICLIGGLSLFEIDISKPTALVSYPIKSSVEKTQTTPSLPRSPINPSTSSTVTSPTPIIISPLPTLPHPSINPLKTPHGFPIASSCVIQIPGEPFSHQNLNAVDIADISQNNAWEVRSTHAGEVILTDNFGGYGLAVLVESLNQNFITYYTHLAPGSIRVRVGDIIERNTLLGIVDNTGSSTGIHLHYEIRGPRSSSYPWGSKEGEFGRIGTIINFLPDCQTWSCGQEYCQNI